MSAAIYRAPKNIEKPKFPSLGKGNVNEKIKKWREAEDKYVQTLRDLLKKNFKDKNAGEMIKFPVADGYAYYMVVSTSPAKLMHVPIGDEWSFQYVHLMTPEEIQKKIDQEKALDKMFGK